MLNDAKSLSSIYMGTLVGAGFASGQEIIRFFTIYGLRGFFGLIVACLLFFIIGYFVLKTAIRYQTTTFQDFMYPLYGKNLTNAFELISSIYLITSFYIMLAGCGAVLWEGLQVPYPLTIVALSFVCIYLLKSGIEGIAKANNFLVPMMLILTVAMGVATSFNIQDILVSDIPVLGKGHWLLSSILYVCFNMTSGVVVLFSLGTYTKWKSAAFIASLTASIGLFVMGVLIWAITVVNLKDIINVQVPLLFAAKKLGIFYFGVSIIVLLSAMITTALSSGYAFIRGLQKRFNINYNFGIFVLVIGMPLSFYGFSQLVKTIYPLFGLISMAFILIVIFKKVFRI